MISHDTNGNSIGIITDTPNNGTRSSKSSRPHDEENECASIHTFYSASEGLQSDDDGYHHTPRNEHQEEVPSATTTGWSLITPQLVNRLDGSFTLSAFDCDATSTESKVRQTGRLDAPFTQPEYLGPPVEPQCSSRLQGPFSMPEEAPFALNDQPHHDHNRNAGDGRHASYWSDASTKLKPRSTQEVQRFVRDKLAPGNRLPSTVLQPPAINPLKKDNIPLPSKTDGTRKGRSKLTKNKKPSNPSSGPVIAQPPPAPCPPRPVVRQHQESRGYAVEKKRPAPLNLDKSSLNFSESVSSHNRTATSANKKPLARDSTHSPKKRPSTLQKSSAVVSETPIKTKQPSIRRPAQGQIGNYSSSIDEHRPVSPVSCGSLGSPVSPITPSWSKQASLPRKTSDGYGISARDQSDSEVEVLQPTKGQPKRVDFKIRSRLGDLARGYCLPTPDGDSDVEADSTLWWPVPPRHGGFAARFEFCVSLPLNKSKNKEVNLVNDHDSQEGKEEDEESDSTITITAARSKGKQPAQSKMKTVVDGDGGDREPTVEECLEIKDFELHLTRGKEIRYAEFTEPKYCFRMNDGPAEALYNHESQTARKIRYYGVVRNLSLPRDMDQFKMHASFVARYLCPVNRYSSERKSFPVTLEAWLLDGRWVDKVVDKDHFQFLLAD